MEAIVAGAVLGVGYLLSSNKEKDIVNEKYIKVNPEQKPNGTNLLNSRRSYNIWQDEQKKAQNLFKKTEDPVKTNVLIAGPPYVKKKVDYVEKKLPIEFNEYTDFKTSYLDYNDQQNITPGDDSSVNNSAPPNAGGWAQITTNASPINPGRLEGFTSNQDEKLHNNMQPYFGGHVRQNVDEFATRGIMENFTGVSDTYQKKKETGLFFKPVKNLTNPYGMQSFDSNLYDRFKTSRIRNNEAPIDQIQVGPGLNQGYTAQGSGGFQQSNTRDYVLPKTTNETRVKSNPKVSYKSRVISGSHISQPGKIGTVQKNLPDTFYIQEPDRYLTTTGQTIAQTEYPEFLVKYTNRKTTELKKRIGPAAPVNGTVETIRSKVKRSSKTTFQPDGFRNATIEGQWGLQNSYDENRSGQSDSSSSVPNDYGKKTIKLKPNMRMTTQCRTNQLNLKPAQNNGEYRNNQEPRFTRKTNVVGNPRWASNVQAPHNRHIVYDPNDVARTTGKETLIHNERDGNLTGATKQYVYDPNDVARTTGKETLIHNERDGNLTGATKQYVYDPNDVARTTGKETLIHNERDGNLTGPNRQYVYDPNNIAKTTVRETTEDNKSLGFVGTNQQSKANNSLLDKAKTTLKQLFMVKDSMGNIEKQDGNGAYLNKKETLDADTTNRQTYNNTNYTGGMNDEGATGYQVANMKPRMTKKAIYSDNEHVGNAGNSGQGKPMSYADVYSMTIKSVRDDMNAQNRVPGAQGDKNALGAAAINMTTSKSCHGNNIDIQKRGVQPDRVYNSIPQNIMCSETKPKNTLPNDPLAGRLDPRMVDQFKKNPYTQSLNSYAFP